MKRILLIFALLLSVKALRAQDSLKLDNAKLLEFYQTQKYGEAAQYLEKIYKPDTRNPKELSQLGYLYMMAGKLPDAEKSYLKVYELDSASLPALFSLAGI
ncbi:MAG TPA: hypothetical protein VKB19_13220, partial [Pedobacter sp.]|nr:hypothetical protein [Pedobacter sp.]